MLQTQNRGFITKCIRTTRSSANGGGNIPLEMDSIERGDVRLPHVDLKYIEDKIKPPPDELLGYPFHGRAFRTLRWILFIFKILFLVVPITAAFVGFYMVPIYFMLFVLVYLAYRALLTAYGTLVGVLRYRLAQRVDWYAELEAVLKNWDTLPSSGTLPESPDRFEFVAFIPVYKEGYEVLKSTLEGLKNSRFPVKKHMRVVFAVEERGGAEILATIKRLKREYAKNFRGFHYYVHPKDLPNEMRGIAGPNLRWASIQFMKEMVRQGRQPKDFFIYKLDSDLIFQPNTVAALCVRYLTDPERLYSYYSPAFLLYSNNIWRVPVFTRIFSILISFSYLAEWVTLRGWKRSFSTFGFHGQSLVDAGFWDAKIGVDDTGFYFQAYILYGGRFKAKEVYLPVTMDAVESKDLVSTLRAFYKQQYRWGGGGIVVPMVLATIRRLNAPLVEKVSLLWNFFEVYNIWQLVSIYFSFYLPILLLVFERLVYSSEVFLFSHFLSTLFRLVGYSSYGVLAIFVWLYRKYSLEKDYFSFWERLIITYLEMVIFFPIVSIVFTSIPYIKAQIDLALGRLGKYEAMQKYRK